MVNTQTGGKGEWALLEAHVPGCTPEPIGILLCDLDRNYLHVRTRKRWWDILPDEDASEIWQEFADDLEQRAQEMGSLELLDWLETTASHTLQISKRQSIQILVVETTLDSLFRQHVCAPENSQPPLRIEDPLSLNTPPGGPQPKSPGRALERKSGSSLRTRFTVAALLACVCAKVTLSHGPSHWVRKPVPKAAHEVPETKSDQSILVLVSSGLGYQPSLPNFDLLAKASPNQRSIGKRPSISRQRRRQFNTQSLVLHHPVRVHQMPPPPLHIAVAANPAEPILARSRLITSLLEPPRFQRRHNRFVRVLAVIGSPFRMLASNSPLAADARQIDKIPFDSPSSLILCPSLGERLA